MSVFGMLQRLCCVGGEAGAVAGKLDTTRDSIPGGRDKENTLCNVANLCEGSRIPGIQIARTLCSTDDTETSPATTLERG
jgi:hypothetical protein